jgi:hypothetical protein
MKIRYTLFFSTQLLITTPLIAQDSVNCFLEDFQFKNAVIPENEEAAKTPLEPTVTVTINAGDTLGKVSRYLYGNNANVYMTQMVNEPVLLSHINKLRPNIIRFPGGNLSNIFFWNANPNQPPNDVPDSLYDDQGNKFSATNFWWYGRNTASFTLSVDNYYEMLNQTGNTGSICVNFSYSRYGTGPDPAATAAQYAADWVRYDDGRTKFWEIGNEDFGPWQAGYKIDTTLNQDGQTEIISGTIYGKHFKIFADSMQSAAQEIGSTIFIGAQLIEDPAGNSWIPPARTWNQEFFSQAGNSADFFIVHNYFTNFGENSNATVIMNSATARTTNIMNYMRQTTSENQASMKPVALTEWNIFAEGSKQMVSFINGMHAAIVLGELAKNGYSMASRWDFANGYSNGNDHGMFSQGDEPNVPKWNPRPDFFYMYYFQKFFGDHIVNSSVTGSNNVLAYSSIFQSGHAGIVVINKGTTEQVIGLSSEDFMAGNKYYIYSLEGGSDNGEFSPSVYVNETAPSNATGGPIDDLEEISAWAYTIGNGAKFVSPARSVQYILIEPGSTPLDIDGREVVQNIETFYLYQNYPNPFNPTTNFEFRIAEFGLVSLKVFDVLGNEIAILINEERPAGTYKIAFDAANVPSGVYFYRLETNNFIETKKMSLLK